MAITPNSSGPADSAGVSADPAGGAASPQTRVLGTSNSVLRGGWIDGLRDSSSAEVSNLSVGASASAYVLWQLADAGLPTADDAGLYFLDTLVNDETFIAAKRFQFNWWAYYQQAIQAALPPEKTIAIGFSSRKFFMPPSVQAMMQEAMCLERGARFVSLRRILLASMQLAAKARPTVDLDDVFEDPGHFHRHLARLFGAWLGRNLSPVGALASTVRPISEAGFETLVPTDHDGREEVRSTSLRSQDTIVLGLGQSFTLPGSRILHGISIDASNTRCVIDVDTGDDQRASYELGYNTATGRMQVKFVHFPRPIILGKDGARVTVTTEPAFRLVRGVHSRPGPAPYHGLRLLSFLSGPLVARPAMPDFEAAGYPDTLTDLEQDCLRDSGLVDVLVDPPDLPKYPRSFIEL